jgi:lipoate-protein ligase A
VATLAAWWDGDAEGVVNMALDEALGAAAERSGRPLIRFYGWSRPTVSLGAFQKLDDARGIADIVPADLVRRPSGGGAIVHGSDLTYALAVPKTHPLGGTAQQLYTAAHTALAAVLATHGINARLYDERPTDEDFFCFSRRAGGDVVVTPSGREPSASDPKIMGSAQRRLAGAVVQHGSLLLRENPGVGPAARHPGVENLAPRFEPHAPRQLADAWLTRLAAAMETVFCWEPGPFMPPPHEGLRTRLAYYSDPRWLARR